MSQRLTIVGPNLEDQSKGTFHVHAAGCAHLNQRQYRYVQTWTATFATRTEVCDDAYPPEDFDCDSGEYLFDFHFSPCVTIPLT